MLTQYSLIQKNFELRFRRLGLEFFKLTLFETVQLAGTAELRHGNSESHLAKIPIFLNLTLLEQINEAKWALL